jgi:predicted nucleic acid-binding Zn ribbon protein
MQSNVSPPLFKGDGFYSTDYKKQDGGAKKK